MHSFKTDSLVRIIYSPILGNSKIRVNANFIINEWLNKGIRNIMDLIHLLFHCKNVLDFWNTLKTWLQRTTNITLQIDLKKIIFSYPAQPLVSYCVTLLQLQSIYIKVNFSPKI